MSLPLMTSVGSRPATPARDVAQPIQFVATATNNYVAAGDQVVSLRVNGQVFKVSKDRLMLRSPVFREMFGLPEKIAAEGDLDNGSVFQKVKHDDERDPVDVDLHNDLEEFKDFLWYIHADPLAAISFAEAENTPKKCMVLLGIASIAHMYQALEVANWAMRSALGILMQTARPFSLDSTLAARLLRTAARFQERDTTLFLTNARDVVCDAMHPKRTGTLSADPISAVRVSQEVEDTYVLGHAYFYTLEKGNDYWLEDARLRARDRRRLVCGGLLFLQRQLQRLRDEPGLLLGVYPEQSWDVRRKDPWEPLLHSEIQHCRNELWALFDCEAWRLVEKIIPSPGQ